MAFSPDATVAQIRGYTAPYKIILAEDPRIRAIEEFDWALEKLLAERFQGFGIETAIKNEELRDVARKVGLPIDVAEHLAHQRSMHSLEIGKRYL